MKRKIISIDEQKCNGCGLCISACHEGALELVDGVAKLVSDSYCDGLGNCLPECPTGAIEIIEREAEPFDEDAVAERMKNMDNGKSNCHSGGCPGSRVMSLDSKAANKAVKENEAQGNLQSQLGQWPCQIKLVPVNAPYFDNASLLIAADCTAYAYGNIHNDFMKNKITLIGCPKLDDTDYSEKLAEIIKRNRIKSVTVLRMSVPCCGGIEYAVKQALVTSGKMIPWNVIIISPDGSVVDRM